MPSSVARVFGCVVKAKSNWSSKESFQLSVASNSRLFWFWLSTLWDWFKKTCHFLDQWLELNQKTVMMPCSHAFPRARCLLPTFSFEFGLVHSVVYVCQPSTQALFSHSLDSTWWEMLWRHRMAFGDVTKFRAKSCKREENAWVLSCRSAMIG